jgi:hypothetical protein
MTVDYDHKFVSSVPVLPARYFFRQAKTRDSRQYVRYGKGARRSMAEKYKRTIG